ncbi:MAG TPA: RNA polymerase factor sigma-54 [Balneolales bacterium]|nr:RNA polymerase factor sigma-54 [Balneolales bacterium]
MISSGQYLSQKQTLQQRLSPQQIQYIKLLQLPTLAFEQRIKEELEENPVLEDGSVGTDQELSANGDSGTEETEPVDTDEKIDWDEYLHGDERSAYKAGSYDPNQDWRDLPKPYHETMLEEIENQVALLNLNDREQLIADQIIGSIDSDGYFRRDITSLIDSIAFNDATLVTREEVEEVLHKIQQLDPSGIAARDLRECLLIQLESMPEDIDGRELAREIVRYEWESFEKKHFDRIRNKLGVTDEEMRDAYECIHSLNPKPGIGEEDLAESSQYIEPDFLVHYEPSGTNGEEDGKEQGDFVIILNNRNYPQLHISSSYRNMWEGLKHENSIEAKKTRRFIKNKIESAQWFKDSIVQRQNTLMNVMRTIVALQEDFFKYGTGIRPMKLKDVADRISMDISTVSRVVNGKYVQTNFGVHELKYFFNEGVETESGEEVSNLEIKNVLQEIIDAENKSRPYSDQNLVKELKKKGYVIARRTVSKYREQLNIPVARLRKQL